MEIHRYILVNDVYKKLIISDDKVFIDGVDVTGEPKKTLSEKVVIRKENGFLYFNKDAVKEALKEFLYYLRKYHNSDVHDRKAKEIFGEDLVK